MKKPTLSQLNKIRKEGYRPGVVSCIIHQKKLLMFYKNEHKLWQLPQGRIDNREDPLDSLTRELTEEVGKKAVAHMDIKKAVFLDFDKMEFKPGSHEVGELKDDEGNEIAMLGKVYFFYVINADSSEIDLKETQFDQFFWLSFREAYFLADRMYQKGKRRITLKIINLLLENNLVE